MICPVTGWIFASLKGDHLPCPSCGHCLLCDHNKEPPMHADMRDSQRMKGLNCRMYPTPNREAFCHVPLCTACKAGIPSCKPEDN